MISSPPSRVSVSSKTVETLSSAKKLEVSDKSIAKSQKNPIDFPNKSRQASLNKCKKHHRMNLDILCLTDSIMICSHCAIFQGHKDHDFIARSDMEIEISNLQTEINDIQKFIMGQMKTQYEFSYRIQQQKVEQKKKEATKQVKIGFNKLYKELEKMEKDNYQQINNFFQKEIVTIQQQFHQISEKMKNKSCELAREWGVDLAENQLIDCISVFQTYLKAVNESPSNRITLQGFQDQFQSSLEKAKKDVQERLNCFNITVEPLPNILEKLNGYITFSDSGKTADKEKRIPRKCSRSVTSGNQNGSNRTSVIKKDERGYSNSKNTSPCKRFQTKHNCASTKAVKCQNFFKAPILQKVSANKSIETTINSFILDLSKQTLDLSNIANVHSNLVSWVNKILETREIPRIKLSRTAMTDQQLTTILPLLSSTESLNISFNSITEDSLTEIINYMSKLPQNKLISINMSRNQISETSKSVKEKISWLKEEFGVTVSF